ncbi:MAG: hypothetical protein K6L80_00650 [Agarilytica sp.]
MFRLMFLFTLPVSINSFALSEKDLEEVRHASEAARHISLSTQRLRYLKRESFG